MKMAEREVIRAVEEAFGNLSVKTMKVYISRNGTPCVIFSSHTGGDHPLLGAWYDGVESWHPCKWTADGLFPSINESVSHSALDLIMRGDEQA